MEQEGQVGVPSCKTYVIDLEIYSKSNGAPLQDYNRMRFTFCMVILYGVCLYGEWIRGR